MLIVQNNNILSETGHTIKNKLTLFSLSHTKLKEGYENVIGNDVTIVISPYSRIHLDPC